MPENLIFLSPQERIRCRRLIRRLCANYDGGNCLLLDDGDTHPCPQCISFWLLCRYFREAVLPAEPELEAELYRVPVRTCTNCGRIFRPRSNRQKYCCECAALIHRRQKTAGERKRRRSGPLAS